MDNFQGMTPSNWPFFSAFNAFRIFFIIFHFQLGLFCGAFVILLISVVLSWIFYDFSVVGSNEEPKVGIVANKDINKELKNDWRIVARYAQCKLFSCKEGNSSSSNEQGVHKQSNIRTNRIGEK